MLVNRQFKFRMYPDQPTQDILNGWFGVSRAIWNCALDQRKNWYDRYKAVEGKGLSFYSQNKELTELRKEFDWIKAMPQESAEYVLQKLDFAMKAFYKGGGFPKFKSKYDTTNSIKFRGDKVVKNRFIQNTKITKIDDRYSSVKVAKLPEIKVRMHRELPEGKICQSTIIKDASGWYLVVNIEFEQEESADKGYVGIDRGVAIPVVTSAGDMYHLPHTIDKAERNRVRKQKKLSRCQKGSNRRQVAKQKLAKASNKITRIRDAFAHQTSKKISDDYSYVAMEDLKIDNMTKSAKGDVDNHGKNVKQKSGLNRSILNSSWGSFEQKLGYKVKHIEKVDPRYTSQICHECGTLDKESRKNQADFICNHCGHQANADVNAAKNILRRACGSLLDGEGSCISTPVKRQSSQSNDIHSKIEEITKYLPNDMIGILNQSKSFQQLGCGYR